MIFSRHTTRPLDDEVSCNEPFGELIGTECVCVTGWSKDDCSWNDVPNVILEKLIISWWFWVTSAVVLALAIFLKLTIKKNDNIQRTIRKLAFDFAFSLYYLFCATCLCWWYFPFQDPEVHWNWDFLYLISAGPLNFIVSFAFHTFTPTRGCFCKTALLADYLSNDIFPKEPPLSRLLVIYLWHFLAALIEIGFVLCSVVIGMWAQTYYFMAEAAALVGWTALWAGLVVQFIIALGYLLQAARVLLQLSGCIPQTYQQNETQFVVPGSGCACCGSGVHPWDMPLVTRVLIRHRIPEGGAGGGLCTPNQPLLASDMQVKNPEPRKFTPSSSSTDEAFDEAVLNRALRMVQPFNDTRV